MILHELCFCCFQIHNRFFESLDFFLDSFALFRCGDHICPDCFKLEILLRQSGTQPLDFRLFLRCVISALFQLTLQTLEVNVRAARRSPAQQ